MKNMKVSSCKIVSSGLEANVEIGVENARLYIQQCERTESVNRIIEDVIGMFLEKCQYEHILIFHEQSSEDYY